MKLSPALVDVTKQLRVYLKSLQKARKFLRPLDDLTPIPNAANSDVWDRTMSQFMQGEALVSDFELLYHTYGDHAADMIMDEWYCTQAILEEIRNTKALKRPIRYKHIGIQPVD